MPTQTQKNFFLLRRPGFSFALNRFCPFLIRILYLALLISGPLGFLHRFARHILPPQNSARLLGPIEIFDVIRPALIGPNRLTERKSATKTLFGAWAIFHKSASYLTVSPTGSILFFSFGLEETGTCRDPGTDPLLPAFTCIPKNYRHKICLQKNYRHKYLLLRGGWGGRTINHYKKSLLPSYPNDPSPDYVLPSKTLSVFHRPHFFFIVLPFSS